MQTEEKTIMLTKEEAEVLEKYLTHKVIRLEESSLTDSYCYPKLLSILHKVRK